SSWSTGRWSRFEAAPAPGRLPPGAATRNLTGRRFWKAIRAMAKQVTAVIRLQVPGGQATPAPPAGPAPGQHGVNLKPFLDQLHDRTKDARGITVPVAIMVFSDRSFTFEIKSPPAAVLLKQAAGIPLEKKKGGEVIPAEEKTKGTGKYKGFK